MATTQQFAVAAAAAAATLFAAPAFSQSLGEFRAPMTSFFVAIPIDAATKKEQEMNFGLQFQGLKPYQAVKVDYQTFKFLPAALAAMEAKYIIAGAVAVGAAVVIAKQDKGKSESFQQQQAQQAETCAQTTQNC
jgi:hypothetical protein